MKYYYSITLTTITEQINIIKFLIEKDVIFQIDNDNTIRCISENKYSEILD